MDLDALEAAGAYDPRAPRAADRRAMFEYLASIGVTDDEIRRAWEGDHLHAAGLRRLFTSGDLNAGELAERVGIDLAEVLEIYRLLGVTIADPDERMLAEAEADGIASLVLATSLFEEGEHDEILRAASAALTNVAEAVVSVFVGGVETRIQLGGTTTDVERAMLTQRGGEIGIEFGQTMGLLFRHHLRQAIDRQRISMEGVPNRQMRAMTIGFVDLVGFTPLSADMSPDELVAFVRDFEARSFDIASANGGRIVKTIGDEVMISALTADAGAAIILDLIDGFRTSGTAPRGGLASGAVVARRGDFFGPVVNLASRLVDAAVPGEVLADVTTADALVAGYRCEPAGRRMLKGFADPVTALSVGRHG